MCDLDTPPYDSPFDSEGTYRDRVVAQTSTSPCTPVAFVDLPSNDYTTAPTDADIDDVIDRCVYYAQTDGAAYSIHNLESTVSASPPRTLLTRTLTMRHCVPTLVGFLLTRLRRLSPALLSTPVCP
jgi:hypothetical protein